MWELQCVEVETCRKLHWERDAFLGELHCGESHCGDVTLWGSRVVGKLL